MSLSVLLARIRITIDNDKCLVSVNYVGKRGVNMGNPLDSLKGTVVLGLVITVIMVLLVNAIAA